MSQAASVSRDSTVGNGFSQIERFQVYTERQLDDIPQLVPLNEEQRFEMRVVANVLPFRVNRYVVEELIDWSNIPVHPVF